MTVSRFESTAGQKNPQWILIWVGSAGHAVNSTGVHRYSPWHHWFWTDGGRIPENRE